MTFWQRLFGTKSRATLENPSTKLSEWFESFGFGKSDADVTVNDETAQTLSAVYRAITLYSSTMASLELGVFKSLQNGDRQQITDHPGARLLTVEPNRVMTAFEFIEALQKYPLTWGNGYAYIHKNIKGEPTELQIYPASEVVVKASEDKRDIFYNLGKDREGVPGRSVLHIKGIGDGFVGVSPIDVARNSLGGGIAVQKYGNKFFANGALQSGVLMYPGQLSTKAQDNLRAAWKKKHGGLKGTEAGGTMVLEEGMKYQPISIPPEQAQFLQSRKFTVEEVARWFGLPPHLLFSSERNSYNSNEQQGIEYVVYSLRPWIKRWEAELNRKLLTEDEKKAGYYFRFNIESLLRGDSQSRATYLISLVNNGIITRNEARNIERLNRYPHKNADKLTVQMQNIPIDDIELYNKNDGTE